MQTTHSSVQVRSNPNWVEVVAGVLLFIAPWVIGYSTETAYLANSLTVGAVAVIAGLLAVGVHHGWSWVNAVAGAYAVVAALVWGGTGGAIATLLILGAIIGIGGLVAALRDQ